MAVITTEAVPPQCRFDFWRDVISQRALLFRMEPVREPSHCELLSETIGDLSLLNFRGALVQRYTRTRAEIARSPVPFYFAQIQIGGSCFVRRGEEEVTLSKGDAFPFQFHATDR